MKKCAALVVGLSLVWSAAGCCCSHLFGCGNVCGYGPTLAPMAPACPGGACGMVPGAMAPGVYQGAALTTTTYATAAAPVSVSPVTYTAQSPVIVTTPQTAMVESLPTY